MEDPDQSKVPKDEARYRPRAQQNARCADCAHYIPGEQTSHGKAMCKVVRGQIQPNAVCLDFYADFGFFADNKMDANPRLTMILERGGVGSWSAAEAQALLDAINEEMAALRRQ